MSSKQLKKQTEDKSSFIEATKENNLSLLSWFVLFPFTLLPHTLFDTLLGKSVTSQRTATAAAAGLTGESEITWSVDDPPFTLILSVPQHLNLPSSMVTYCQSCDSDDVILMAASLTVIMNELQFPAGGRPPAAHHQLVLQKQSGNLQVFSAKCPKWKT